MYRTNFTDYNSKQPVCRMPLFVFVVEQNKNELLAQNISVLKINRLNYSIVPCVDGIKNNGLNVFQLFPHKW